MQSPDCPTNLGGAGTCVKAVRGDSPTIHKRRTSPFGTSTGKAVGVSTPSGPNSKTIGITTYGVPNYSMDVNTAPLKDDLGGRFKLMMIARVANGAVDRITDTGIEKSPLYTITGEPVTIFHQGTGKLRFPIGDSYVELNLVTVPVAYTADQITCLADVLNLGGQIPAARITFHPRHLRGAPLAL